MGKKINTGDIFEIKTPKGFAYVQYTYSDDVYGQLIRVLPGIFDVRPITFNQLSQSRELYFVFFPVRSAVFKNIITSVAHEPIPYFAQQFPPMRKRGGIGADGKVLNWWIYDTKGKISVDQLNEEQRNYSIMEIWNYTMLVECICSGWMPEKET